jgi:signal transduction histidine kinase
MERIAANGANYAARDGIKLPPLIRNLEVDYTALSFVVPQKVRFLYKLEGHDKEWQDSQGRRQAFYSDLPPGPYRFRVRACNNSGVWNEAGTFLDFSVAPAYYQTTWFRLSCVAAFLVLLWAVYQLRLRRVTQRVQQRMQGRFEERERIARELHDTLLQSFQGVLLCFQGAVKLLSDRPDLARAKERMESAIEIGAQAIAEGRDAIQGLRSSAAETAILLWH